MNPLSKTSHSPSASSPPKPGPSQRDNLTRRLSKAFGANALSQVIRLANRLFLPPLFIHHWGPALYGEWLMLFSVVYTLSLSDLGGRLYITNRLTAALEMGRRSEFLRLLHTSLLVFFGLGLIIGGLFVGAVAIFGPKAVLNIGESHPHEVMLSMAFLSLTQVLGVMQGLSAGIFRAAGFTHRGTHVLNFTEASQILAAGICLAMGGSFNAVALSYLIPMAISTLISFTLIERQFPDFQIRHLGRINSKAIKIWVLPSLQFFWINLALVLSVQGVIYVAGLQLSSPELAVFGTMRTMAAVITALLGVFSLAAASEFTRLDVVRQKKGLRTLFEFVTGSTLLLGLFLSGFFHYAGEKVHHLWLGRSIAYDSTTMDLFLVYMFQSVFWGNHKQLMMSINQQKGLSRTMFVTAILSLVGAYYGAKLGGVQGVIIGLTLSELCLPFWLVPVLAGRYRAALGVGPSLREFSFFLTGLVFSYFHFGLFILSVIVLCARWRRQLFKFSQLRKT